MPRILITGSMGQLGQGLGKMLRQKFGPENVIMSDVKKLSKICRAKVDPYLHVDILNAESLHAVVVNYQIDWLINFSAVLSAIGEQDVQKALKINVIGLHNILEASRAHNLRVFIPSTIGAFGPTTPRIKTPDITIQRPKTIYGVSKVYTELLGEYYNSRYNVDFRSLRFPGIISADTNPGGGTTDYAVKIFHDAVSSGRHHECYLKPNTRLPMMYIDDCLRSVIEIFDTPDQKLTSRCYNITAMSFTPDEISAAIKSRIPSFSIGYKTCPTRQAIADSWPESLDDSKAKNDWGWKSDYDLNATVDRMLDLLTPNAERQRDVEMQKI